MWLGVAVSFLLASCSVDESEKTKDTIRIATQPYQYSQKSQDTYKELVDHIASHTGLNTEHIIPKSYEESLHLFNTKQLDIALFGGVAYVKAHMQSKAMPLVMPSIESDSRSVAIIQANNPASSLRELKDASIAFAGRNSISGHFVPRYFFQQKNINPEEFFSRVEYSGTHDIIAEWVRDGKVDLGLVNSNVLNRMFQDGRLSKGDIKVIWLSPPYQDYVWAVQPDISKRLRTVLRDAFLSLKFDAKNKTLLQNMETKYFIPATHDDFKGLEQIILQIEQRETVQ